MKNDHRKHRKLVQKLLKYGEELLSVKKNPDTERLIRYYIKECPHAFVIGCVMDKRIPYAKAWEIPNLLKKELGGFQLDMLLNREKKVRRLFEKNKLHRHPTKAAEEMMDALKRIRRVYNGDASRIWGPSKAALEIVRDFREFKGIGQKIANMAVKILAQYTNLTGKEFIDIAVDVHVGRVFCRTGLVGGSPSDSSFAQRIIDKARELHPDYPAKFDTPAWRIGMDYCHAKKPDCNRCPLDSHCEKVGV